MKLTKIIVLICFGVYFLPHFFARAKDPKNVTVTDLMNQCRKDQTSENVETRRRALEGFYTLSGELSHVVTSLQISLHDPDDEIRLMAVKALARVGPSVGRSGGAVSGLFEIIQKDKLPEVRIAAVTALGNVFSRGCNPTYAKSGISVLIHAMRKDEDVLVRRSACRAFRMIGPLGKDAAPYLVEIIKNKNDPNMRELACYSLGEIVGPDSKEIVPTLLEMYKHDDEDSQVRGTVLVLLGKIAFPENVALPIFIDALNDPNKLELRSSAALGISYLGAKAKACVPALKNALDITPYKDKDKAYITAYAVLRALGSMGSHANGAVPEIRALVKNQRLDERIRRDAEDALKLIEK